MGKKIIFLTLIIGIILGFIYVSLNNQKTNFIRKAFPNPQFSLSILVPNGFKYEQKDNYLKIWDNQIEIIITRKLWPANKLFSIGDGPPDPSINPRISTMQRIEVPDNLVVKALKKEDYDMLIQKSIMKRVVDDNLIKLDNKEIYTDQDCFYSRSVSEKTPLDFYKSMEIFIRDNKYDSLEFCSVAQDKQAGIKNYAKYQMILNKMVMSIQDIKK
jgi:hypothetical protein